MKKITISLIICSLLGLPLLRSTDDEHSLQVEALCEAAQELATQFPADEAQELKQDIEVLAAELALLDEPSIDELENEESPWHATLRNFFYRLQTKVSGGRLSRGPVEHFVDTVDGWMRLGIATGTSVFAYRNVPPKSVLAVMYVALEQESLPDGIRDANEFVKKRTAEEMAMFNQCIKYLVSTAVFAGTRVGLWFFI